MISKLAAKRLYRYALKVASKVRSQSSGSFKSFTKLTESWGIKFARDKENIIRNFALQRRASRFGLGPYCFGLFKCLHCSGFHIYGYITEVVQVESDTDKHNRFWDEARDNEKCVRHLCRRLWWAIHFNFEDTQWRNMGIKNGKLLCIDFDPLHWGLETIVA